MDFIKMTVENTDKSIDRYLVDRININIVIDHLRLFMEYCKGDWVLDLGCGHGRDCWFFEEHWYKTIGIDLSGKMLEVARKRCKKSFFLKMDMRDIDKIPWLFDGVWASASLYHLPKNVLPDVLHQIYNILNPNGVLYVGVKEGDGEKILGRSELGVTKFYSFYTKDEIVNIISDAGFKVLDVVVRGWLDGSRKEDVWINVFAVKK